MKIVKLQENLLQYIIAAPTESKTGLNFFVLLNGSKALLIDAGYRRECKMVLDDLSSRGIFVVKVIPSHFHPDHVEGIMLIDKPEVYGNSYAQQTLSMFYDDDAVKQMSPTHIINDDTTVSFGGFELSFASAPGHSDCTMLIIINNKYVHIGDLYIRKDTGEDILPFVKWANVQQHLKSLNMLLEYGDKEFLISHGFCPISFAELSRGIKDRNIYLSALLDSNNTVSGQDAVKDCSKPFSFMHWREFVK